MARDAGYQLSVSNRETWAEDMDFVDDDTGEAFDISDATEITLRLEEIDGSNELNATFSGGDILLTADNEIRFSFTVDQMRSLDPGEYKLGIVITFPEEVKQALIASVSVLDGIVE